MNNSFTIHKRNVQTLAIDISKVAYGISPKIMKLVFPTKENAQYPWNDIFRTFNVKTVYWGTETLSHIGPKIWSIIPISLKNYPTRNLEKLFAHGTLKDVHAECANITYKA